MPPDRRSTRAGDGLRPQTVPPTMRDIAIVAGVSQSTVSRVLNDAPTRVPIAAQTRERVTAAARELGYRPNPLARALRGAPTMLLGAVVRDFSDPFFADAIEALVREAMTRGYNVVLGHATGGQDESISLATVIEVRHTDAVVLLGDMQDQPRLLDDLRNSSVPVVALWHGASPLEFPTVDVDERAGIVTGLEHLIELGHERIALVSATLPGNNRQREEAFLDFMRERSRSVPQAYIREVPNTLGGAEDALNGLLDLADPPTAILATTDLVAVGVLHAAYSQGRTVPDQLSVVGFDDILIAAHTVPALTTLRMPTTEIVREGVNTAIDLARDESAPRDPRIRVFEPTLVVRQSTSRPGP